LVPLILTHAGAAGVTTRRVTPTPAEVIGLEVIGGDTKLAAHAGRQ
jgi:hypothetical protein